LAPPIGHNFSTIPFPGQPLAGWDAQFVGGRWMLAGARKIDDTTFTVDAVILNRDGSHGTPAEVGRSSNGAIYVQVVDDGVDAIVVWSQLDDDLAIHAARVTYDGEVLDHGSAVIPFEDPPRVDRNVVGNGDGSFTIVATAEIAAPPDRGRELHTWIATLDGADNGTPPPNDPTDTSASGCGCRQTGGASWPVGFLILCALRRRRRN